jgi:acetyl esterase/lipase
MTSTLRAYADVLGVDTSRIGVWGESAGGHLASLVALTAQRPELEGTLGVLDESSAVDAVVDWYGPADLTTPPPPDSVAQPPELLPAPHDILVGGQDQNAYAAASPISYVTPAAPPFLLVHGTADTTVRYLHSEVLARALTEAGVPVRLVPVEGADHIFNGHDDIDGVVGYRWTISPKPCCQCDRRTRPRSKAAVLARLGRQWIATGGPVQDAGPLQELI